MTNIGRPEIYSREYYQRIAELEDRHWWHLGMREVASALIRSHPGHTQHWRVLDAGCGTGGGITWAQNILGSKTVMGIDISRDALDLCRRRQSCRLLSQASIVQLPFRNESFDLVLCHDVLQHLPTDGLDKSALAEMHRVLRPGGLLLARANSRLGMWQEETAPDTDFQRYTLQEIASRFEAAGFVVRRATYANCLPGLYASLKRWLHHRSSFRHTHHRLYEGLNLGETAFRRYWLNRLLLWIIKAEAVYLSASKRSLAFGHSTFCLGVKPPDAA